LLHELDVGEIELSARYNTYLTGTMEMSEPRQVARKIENISQKNLNVNLQQFSVKCNGGKIPTFCVHKTVDNTIMVIS
jgi:hypothetical protein